MVVAFQVIKNRLLEAHQIASFPGAQPRAQSQGCISALRKRSEDMIVSRDINQASEALQNQTLNGFICHSNHCYLLGFGNPAPLLWGCTARALAGCCLKSRPLTSRVKRLTVLGLLLLLRHRMMEHASKSLLG